MSIAPCANFWGEPHKRARATATSILAPCTPQVPRPTGGSEVLIPANGLLPEPFAHPSMYTRAMQDALFFEFVLAPPNERLSPLNSTLPKWPRLRIPKSARICAQHGGFGGGFAAANFLFWCCARNERPSGDSIGAACASWHDTYARAFTYA